MCFGETPNPPKPKKGDDCKDTKGKCPCPPISGVEVISVDYVSGHALLKDEKTNWTDTGTVYPKPEWLKGRAEQSPVSHSMDKPVKLKVVLKVKPEDACPEEGTLECTAPDGLNFKLEGITYKAGDNQFEIQSDGNLPKKVKKLNFNLSWKAKPESGTFSSSSQNELFVTIDTPINEGNQEDGVTYKRMAKAVELVGGANSTDPHKIVAHLMKKFPHYTLEMNINVDAKYEHPTYFNGDNGVPDAGGAWGMADYIKQSGECQAIVRFVRGVIKQIGCPGETKVMMVWADPTVNNGNTVLEQEFGDGLANVEKKVKGKTWYAALADSDVEVGRRYTSEDVGMNNFEACLKFTHGGVAKYYGGGAGVYDTKEEVIQAFEALVWYSVVSRRGVTYNKIEQVVKRY